MPLDGSFDQRRPYRPPGLIPQGIPLLDPNDPINTGLVGLWLPGRTGGYDLSGHGNHATAVGAPGVAPTPIGHGVQLNGSSQYLTLPPSFGATTGPITVMAYGTLDEYPAAAGVLVCRVSQGSPYPQNWVLAINSTGKPYFASSADSYLSAASPNAVALGAYQTVAGTYAGLAAGGARRLWVGGANVATATNSSNPPTSIGSSLPTIGVGSTDSPAYYYDGVIAIVRVWLLDMSPFMARLGADPFAGLVFFPSDRRWLYGAAATGSGISVSAAALFAAEGRAGIARALALPHEASARAMLSRGIAAESATTVVPASAFPAEWAAARLWEAAVPAEWLGAADGVAATPAEALAALAGGAIIAVENAGALSLVVAAAAALPLEWQEAARPVPVARLLVSPGRLRILSAPARRRLLASAGRLRTLKPVDR